MINRTTPVSKLLMTPADEQQNRPPFLLFGPRCKRQIAIDGHQNADQTHHKTFLWFFSVFPQATRVRHWTMARPRPFQWKFRKNSPQRHNSIKSTLKVNSSLPISVVNSKFAYSKSKSVKSALFSIGPLAATVCRSTQVPGALQRWIRSKLKNKNKMGALRLPIMRFPLFYSNLL